MNPFFVNARGCYVNVITFCYFKKINKKTKRKKQNFVKFPLLVFYANAAARACHPVKCIKETKQVWYEISWMLLFNLKFQTPIFKKKFSNFSLLDPLVQLEYRMRSFCKKDLRNKILNHVFILKKK